MFHKLGDLLSNYQFLKKGSAPCNYFNSKLRNAMKIYGGVDGCVESWVCPRSGLEAGNTGNILPLPGSEPQISRSFSYRSPAAIPTELCRLDMNAVYCLCSCVFDTVSHPVQCNRKRNIPSKSSTQ
jgi:hypothetical protein